MKYISKMKWPCNNLKFLLWSKTKINLGVGNVVQIKKYYMFHNINFMEFCRNLFSAVLTQVNCPEN